MAIELERQAHNNLQNDAYQTGRLRRSTLVNLRWMAIAGQFLSASFVYFGLKMTFPFVAVMTMVGISAVVNMLIIRYAPLDRRISDVEAGAQISFDVLQLCGLLFLTGGLTNPFVFLLLAPVVVSAKTMNRSVFIMIALMVMGLAFALLYKHRPLPWFNGEFLELPPPYLYGIWLSLLITMLFTAAYTWKSYQQTRRMTKALIATDAVLAHEQKLTALGHLAAAAAHELGTPLATIQLVAKEMSIAHQHDPALKEDTALLLSQARRCRDILSNLTTQNERTDAIYNSISLEAFIAEIVDKFRAAHPAIAININLMPPDDGKTGDGSIEQTPNIVRHPEFQYCLTNLIENAIDFAVNEVNLNAHWDQNKIWVDIVDDGPGFDNAIIKRLGEPYISYRSEQHKSSGGLGLGLFISRTLLNRRGGNITFKNRKPGPGAQVTISWPNSQPNH